MKIKTSKFKLPKVLLNKYLIESSTGLGSVYLYKDDFRSLQNLLVYVKS